MGGMEGILWDVVHPCLGRTACDRAPRGRGERESQAQENKLGFWNRKVESIESWTKKRGWDVFRGVDKGR